jgi:hypothetical protein
MRCADQRDMRLVVVTDFILFFLLVSGVGDMRGMRILRMARLPLQARRGLRLCFGIETR